jgi:multisubunit Na+/H+ antiporter MnhB subunit
VNLLKPLAASATSRSLLIRKLGNPAAMPSLSFPMRTISNVCFYLFFGYSINLHLVALDRADGRKVDGRRVVVDYERGRTR